MSTPGIAVPGTVVPSGSLTSPGGAQGAQGLSADAMAIGAIIKWPTTTAPAGWMICDGSAISRTTYPELFSLIGTTFGAGDGSTTFNLPDHRGRVGVGAGQGASLTNRVLGTNGGEENHQLTIAELASHTHTQTAHQHLFPYAAIVLQTGTGATMPNVGGAAGGPYGGTTSVAAVNQNAGSDGAHNTMQPFLVLAFIIKVSMGGGPTAQAPIADTTQSGLLRQVSGRVTDFVDGTNNVQPIGGSFLTKTAAYTLTVTDSNKYFLLSGGSWTLTLPAPLIGLTYDLRNDMGISGTTGTITIQPTGGTIDGAVSLALLPAQECKLRCDGTNWRTFGLKREVIIGTKDITSAQANGVVLLPVGFRYFELEFTGFISSAASDALMGQFSVDGGNTWTASTYYQGLIYNSSATALTQLDSSNVSQFYILPNVQGPASYTEGRLTFYPGSASPVLYPNWRVHSIGRLTYEYQWIAGGLFGTVGPINALKYFFNGTINNGFVTVKGVA